MANTAQIKSLIRLRGAMKSKLTRFEIFLDKPSDQIDLIDLKSKLTEMTALKVRFEETQTEIESLVLDEDLDNQYAERGDFEDRLSAACAKAQRVINEREPVMPMINAPSNALLSRDSVNANDQNLLAIDHPINLKLPALNLPSFSGSYEKWPSFSDTFRSSVHNDKRFTDSQRLIYLRTCLTGKAADKVESLETTDANYQVAWRILEKYYDDPSAVINNHVKSFFELSNCQSSSASSIGELLNNVTKHYRALEALNKPFLEAFPIYAVTSKLDSQTLVKWKEHTQGKISPTMEDLLEFLHGREKVLESNRIVPRVDKIEKNRLLNDHHRGTNRTPQNRSNFNRPALAYSTQAKSFCHICKGSHFTQNCEKLLKSTLPERLDIVKTLKLCFNCLRTNHSLENCNASACKTCNKKHHTLLHQDNSQRPVSVNCSSLQNTNSSRVLLSTAVIHILDNKGHPHTCRALLDNGSQVNFITDKLAARLGLKQSEIDISLGGVNQMNSSIKKITQSTIQSRLNKYSAKLSFLITPEINDRAPGDRINKVQLKIPANLRLADPEFHIPGEIDVLIGAEIFLKLLCIGQMHLANHDVILQKTHFGWILGGKTPGTNYSNAVVCNLTMDLLHRKIAEFWEIENGPLEKPLSNEETRCEQHYQMTTRRDSDSGRYIVKLPFKENVQNLGESQSRALKRLYSLERSLAKNVELKEQYCDFMREYERLGHMTEDKVNSDTNDGYFLPHHSIIKQSSQTTKLRVVFDASAKTSTGLSLNDVLMVGPNIQDDLFSLLVRFRSHVYAVTADIEKMYRQIELCSNDRKFQKILWRECQQHPIRVFTLNTVTYGTSSASFLATRTLKQLAIDEAESYPFASIALKEDFYMDDLLSGARTIGDAKRLVDELVQATRKGGMNLRQWASNAPELVSSLARKTNNDSLSLTLESNAKTLGIYWNPSLDSLYYNVSPLVEKISVTKRTILSQIAQLFDPLGLLGPVIVRAKIMMQSLWLLKLNWDESVPQEIHTAWLEYYNQLKLLQEIAINRKVIDTNYVTLQIHGFADASENAYGACIYLRSTDQRGRHHVELVCSKSRVAPLNKLTIPRLELCAALLLAKLYSTVVNALCRLSFEKIILWSDSTIALHWIKSPPHTLGTFEGNRVAQIQGLTTPCEWRHVRTEHNPADLVSRGLSPQEFLEKSIWLNGPSWITENEESWPVSVLEIVEIPGTRRSKPLTNLTYTNDFTSSLFSRIGSFTKLKRVIALCQRFINIKVHKQDIKGNLTLKELKKANMCIIRLVQREGFRDEIKALESNKMISGNLVKLNPFLDSEGTLRVGGRLKHSDLIYSQKHPILLPKKHGVTDLVVREQHQKLFHAGAQATLNNIRNNYWIINGRETVKGIIRKCVICSRAKPQTFDYLMGELPRNRTVFERAFLHAGIDYCGPFFIKEKKHRNRIKIKIYAAIFVCFATRAVHIEIVSDLTTEAFLACLKRFFARRGKSSDLYSDNATTFKGAQREISEIYEFLNSLENINKISRVLSDDNINWHFIPPRSPHFGGLWEAAVKSFKHHIVRVVGDRLLTYEQFTTFATEIEGILNSRPLTPLTSDPNDLSALTPGHFLIGESMTGMPEQNLTDLPPGRLSSWQQAQQMKQHFWSRWHKEYLHELTVRKKWHNASTTDIEIGRLVIVREANLPPMRWCLGRIIATTPGTDGIVRVVTVKTAQGIYQRSVKCLSPLPIEASQC